MNSTVAAATAAIASYSLESQFLGKCLYTTRVLCGCSMFGGDRQLDSIVWRREEDKTHYDFQLMFFFIILFSEEKEKGGNS